MRFKQSVTDLALWLLGNGKLDVYLWWILFYYGKMQYLRILKWVYNV